MMSLESSVRVFPSNCVIIVVASNIFFNMNVYLRDLLEGRLTQKCEFTHSQICSVFGRMLVTQQKFWSSVTPFSSCCLRMTHSAKTTGVLSNSVLLSVLRAR